jgi:two-component system response regulator
VLPLAYTVQDENSVDSRADHILVVEDNPDDEAMTLAALESGGVKQPVFVARDGVEALEHLYGAVSGAQSGGGRDGRPLPMVVLLDLKLPKVDGLQVLARIRSEETTKDLPVVVLTSSDEQRDLVDSYNLGVNAYVRKPVSFGELVEAVRQLGIYWMSIAPGTGGRKS